MSGVSLPLCPPFSVCRSLTPGREAPGHGDGFHGALLHCGQSYFQGIVDLLVRVEIVMAFCLGFHDFRRVCLLEQFAMMADSLSESLIPVVKEQDVFIPMSDDADLIAEFGRGNLYGMVIFAELFLGDVRSDLPAREFLSCSMSRRSRGKSSMEATARADSDLPVPGIPTRRIPLGLGSDESGA